MSLRVTRQYTDVLGGGNGLARVTRQSIDVLGSGAGTARVTRQYVDVLSDAYPGIEAPAADTITLHDSAAVIRVRYGAASDTLAMTDVVIRVCVEIARSASDDVTFTETVLGFVVASASDSFTTHDTVTCLLERQRAADDTIVVSESAHRLLSRFVDQSDTLVYTETADALYVKPVADTFSVVDTAVSTKVYRRTRHDTLFITEVVGLTKTLSKINADTLVIVEVAAPNTVRSRSLQDTVAITEQASGIPCKVSRDTISISDVADGEVVRYGIDLLVIEETATVSMIRNVGANDRVRVRETTAGPGWHLRTTGDSLQSTWVSYNPTTLEPIVTYIGLQDLATASLDRAAPLTAEDHLSFGERSYGIKILADAIACTADDTLTFTESAWDNETPVAVDALTLSDAAQVVASSLLGDLLDLTDTAECNVVRNLVSTDLLEVGESLAWHNRLEDSVHVYHPFIGTGAAGNPTPPSATLTGPLAGITAPFQLVYPPTGVVTDSVTLRAPEFGNKDQLSFNRILRESRGGTTINFADPIWPKVQTLALNFRGLTRSEAQDLLDFFQDYLGVEVGMIDWEQRYWRGIVITPEEPVIEDSFNNYSASFKFEGELDNTWSPQTIPWLPGTPLRRVRHDYTSVNPMEPEPTPEMPTDAYNAIADSTMLAGTAVYVKLNGHIDAAKADTLPSTGAVGLLYSDVSAGHTGYYLTEGRITKTDWTTIIGETTLTPGARYFVSADVAGQLVTTPPGAGYVARAARATSEYTLDIEVDEPIRL